jgi:hypothetical protein
MTLFDCVVFGLVGVFAGLGVAACILAGIVLAF